jgi:thiazole/oxazole-forming peptide maturase SagD family component
MSPHQDTAGLHIRRHPAMRHLLEEYRRIGGNQGGILTGQFMTISEVRGEPFTPTMTSTMPAYHKIFMGESQFDMEYHLGGYGFFREEALVRLTGEAVERYAGIAALSALADEVEYASYRDLSSRNECMPLEYLALFEPGQQRFLSSRMPQYAPELPTERDVLAWLPCPALADPSRTIYTPVQSMMLGHRPSPERGDRSFVAAFSTGTASHRSLTSALVNAIVEAIQIDAFMLHWYTDCPAPELDVDDPRALAALARMGLGADRVYRPRIAVLTRPELPLTNFGAYLLRRDDRVPLIGFGLQASSDPLHAVVRAAMESATTLGLGLFTTVYQPERMHMAVNESLYTDLDTNVLAFASPVDAEAKRALIDSRFSDERVRLSQVQPLVEDEDDVLRRLLEMVTGFSRHAVVLDITPAELADTSWKVMRVFVPELVSMSLPGVPPRNHPRIREYGGVVNDRPHPLP